MKVRIIAFWLATLIAVHARAGEYATKALTLTLPDQWAADTYKYPWKTPDTGVFARDGADYPLARVWTLPPGVKLTDPDLVPQMDLDRKADRRVTRDVLMRRDGRPARRIDYVSTAHSDTYFHSVIVIDPGRNAPLIALDVWHTDTTLTDLPFQLSFLERTQRILALQRDIQDMLESFKAARHK